LKLEHAQQRVGHDVAAGPGNPQSVDDEILARARVRHEADLGRLRIDQRRKLLLDLSGEIGVALSDAPGARPLFRVAADRVARDDRHRVRVGAVDVGQPLGDVEIALPRECADRSGQGGPLPRGNRWRRQLWEHRRGGQATEKVTPIDVHVDRLRTTSDARVRR